MERITIKVAEKTAKEWEQASPKLRADLEKRLEEQLEQLLYKNRVEDFKKFLDQIGAEAQANGLTEEKLQEILKEDD
ncbi:MAG TPA: hypothetical protein ENH91_13045 [Leeuwenhoekiella sp.]|nr:hypothetical protein [Leeuwenhoekiella sp.]